MLRPAAMKKINIFLPEEDVEDTVVALARLGTLDLTRSRGDWGEDTERDWRDLEDRYERLTRRLARLLDTLDIGREGGPRPEDVELRSDADELEALLESVEEEVGDWRDRKEENDRRIERLEMLIRSVDTMAPLGVPVERIRDTEWLYLRTGTVARENLEVLETALFRIPFAILPVHRRDDRVLVFAASAREHRAVLDAALRSVFVEPLDLPDDVSGTPGEVLDTLERRLREARQERRELEAEKDRLAAQWRDSLLLRWRQGRTDRRVAGALGRLARRGDLYLVQAWVPTDAEDAAVAAVRRVTGDRADIELLGARRRSERHGAPVLLRNPRILKPFQDVLSTFGFPAYNEVDPTPLVAATFLLMYGMMFGDVGHGTLLAMAGMWLFGSGRSRMLGGLIAAAGMSGVAFGFLYGSVFGRTGLLPVVWLEPLDSIMEILVFSVAAGVALLTVGIVLHLASAAWSRDWGDFLVDRNGLAGLVLYTVLVLAALEALGRLDLPRILLALVGTAAATAIFFHDPLSRLLRGEHPLIEAGGLEFSIQAGAELFETLISYLSNSLSFVRLGAFAVAHAGLSEVVFLLGDLAGSPWRWAVIAIGTVIIVGFEGLIVGVQTLRLEYYEFFGKFFRGTGSPYRPLRLPDLVDATGGRG
ncbi:MAG: V-type ATP synthase subunit I [Candidatus Longimicrobiales bacterium M2_2A_002]